MDEFSTGQFSDADESSPAAYQVSKTDFVFEEECGDWHKSANQVYPESGSDNQDISDYDSGRGEDMNVVEFHGKGSLTNRLNDQRAGRHKCNNNPKQTSTMQPKRKIQSGYGCKINLENLSGFSNLKGSVGNQLSKHESNQYNKITHKDKSDRATVENVFDARTLGFLYRTINTCKLEVHGCVSTGKEANVYHANDCLGNEYAIKVYKTSCITFKNREQYVDGNFKNRRSYSKSSNPRRLVQTWADKEYHNLNLLEKSSINSPKPVQLRGNVLTMEFIGKDGQAAPKLKDAILTADQACEVYLELVIIVRKMYRECKLVHADLSEYDILFFEEKPYIIDVSQSVALEHQRAFEFLKKDLTNITQFFNKNGVHVMLLSQFFYFVVSENVKDEDVDQYLARVQAKNRDSSKIDTNDEEVFKHLYVPRYLNEIASFERDFEDLKSGKITINDLPYVEVMGLDVKDICLNDENTSYEFPTDNENRSGESAEESDADDESCEEGAVAPASDDKPIIILSPEEQEQKYKIEFAAEKERRRPSGRPKFETKEEKHDRMHAVKSEKAEKRQQKMPKKDKKQLVKRARSKRKH